MENCVLAVAGAEAEEVYRTEPLCGGIEAGIEGGIHTTQLFW